MIPLFPLLPSPKKKKKKDQFLGKEGLFGSPLRGGRGRGRKGRTAHEGAVRERVQRRMSHLQALAWVAREAPPPPKRLLLLLFHCLAALRLCSDPWFCAQRGTVAGVPAWEGQGRKAQHLQRGCHSPACSLCHRWLPEDWHGALAKSDSLMFDVVT